MVFYFLGICGTAMGQVAILLKQQGFLVFGCDEKIYPPMSTHLAEQGIEVFLGYEAQRAASLRPDYVVVGNAMTRGNPEVEWLLETEAFPMLSLPELIKRFLISNKKRIVVSGTHGKTTTSSLCAYLLKSNKIDTGYLIGGLCPDLFPSAALGAKGSPFVIEGDEYDSAFFDKRSKFIHYMPHFLGITSIELDHIDIFRDLEDVMRSFRHLVRLLPRTGALVLNGDDPQCQKLLPVPWTRVFQVGTQPHNDLQIKKIRCNPKGPTTTFELWWKGALWQSLSWPLLGPHNIFNAAIAALLAQLSQGLEAPLLELSALARFQGVKRRAQTLLNTPECMVMEDFGHHPSAMAITLQSLRTAYPQKELWACFDPRCNSLRTRHFQNALKAALSHADRVWIGPIDRPEQIPVSDRLDTCTLAAQLTQSGVPSVASPSHEALFENLSALKAFYPRPQLICFFTNGSFGGLPQKLADSSRMQPLAVLD